MFYSPVKLIKITYNKTISYSTSCNFKMPILYHTEISPPSRACRMAAELLGIDLQLKFVDLANREQPKPEFLKMNITHTVPVLNDNGLIIWDSHAILIYLIDKYGSDSSLYPKDVNQRALIHQFLHFDTAVVFPRVSAAVKPIFMKQTECLLQTHIDDVEEMYNYLETILEGKKWLVGDSLTIADLSIFVSIVSIAEVCPIHQNLYKNLIKWIGKCKQISSYNVNLKGVEAFRNLLQLS